MADDTRDSQPERVDAALGGMKIEEEDVHAEDTITVNATYEEAPTPEDATRSMSSTPAVEKPSSQSPDNMESASQSPKTEDEAQDVVGSDITVTVEPGKAPRLSRKSSKKVASRPAPLFNDWPDATAEAVSIFQVIKECIYAHKNMGYSEHDSLDCDCSEEWRDGSNHACGEDSDCINRATKMECVDGDCNCGSACQNQRFQRKQYADVSVIKTEKKGFGLRADRDLSPGDFIFEYIGEVIGDAMFRRRTIQYNEEGIKHFYFMSISKDVFVDATKKGNLGRFCNHSCNPNCYVDKWIVGEKLRMGIFAERHIQAGEELVFNYNVDRYGADPQPCYCGEPNCSGFLGGKTQTERATKLAHAVVEALGIDDGDGWDTAVAKKPRKKKTGEDDEEYVNNVQPKGLDVDGVRKVMAALMQCKEKWIAVKLLARLQRCDDDKVRNRVVQMHGYQILRTTLTTWRDDNNVVLQILDIIYKFPRLTRNKISDSKIENAIETLVSSEHEDVAFESKRLLEDWSKLEVAYRIPRKKFDPSTVSVFERRNTDRVEDVKSPAPAAVVAPTGPRSNMPARNMSFTPSRPPVRRPYHTLPSGWFAAVDEKGNQYYYSKAGATTWHRPTLPAVEPPPPPRIAKSVQSAKALQDIIDSITRPDPSSATPTRTQSSVSTPKEKEKSVEKWRSLPREKQMKIYENTLFPHIKHVMSKFKDKLPKEDLKKFAKEVSKTLVASDYKNNRVTDPTKITAKQEKTVKSYVRGFFEKVVSKKKEHDRKKAEKQKSKLANAPKPTNGSARPEELKAAEDDDAEGLEETNLDSSPLEPDSPPQSPSSPDLKRKRDDAPDTPSQDFESKRLKDDENGSFSASPPPPPPPPPTDSPVPVGDVEMNDAGILATEEEIEMRMQEEALMRENEEAERMDLDGALTMESNSILNNGTGAGEDDTAANGNGNTNGVGSGVETRPAQA